VPPANLENRLAVQNPAKCQLKCATAQEF